MNKLSIQFLLLALCLLTFACKKDKDDAKVDVAASIAGTYNVSYWKEDDDEVTLPQNGYSATIQVSKETNTTVKSLLTLNNNGQRRSTDLGTQTVNRQNDGTVVLSENGQQVATVKGNQLEIIDGGDVIRASK